VTALLLAHHWYRGACGVHHSVEARVHDSQEVLRTGLTRIPCGASSAETLAVSPICPCFEETYAEPAGKEEGWWTSHQPAD
jgi:hypothetical protein